MEDQVPFKVFTYWHKGAAKPEVRRFGVDKNVVSSYTYVHAKIQEIFPKLKGKTFHIFWKDEENDEVKISTDEEIMIMLTAQGDTMVKLYVQCDSGADPVQSSDPVGAAEDEEAAAKESLLFIDVVPPSGEDAPVNPNVPEDLHQGVICDGCDNQVVGFRYKCISCDDFDLCSQCEVNRVHSEHCVVRIPSPSMSLQVIKEALKKSRVFLKSVATTLYEDQKKHASATASAYKTQAKQEVKKERQERREERQERRDERREERREKRECQRQPSRRGWIDVFAKYVDEFANLAGDFQRNAAAAAGTDTDASPDSATARPTADTDATVDTFGRIFNACLREQTECPIGYINSQLKNYAVKVTPGGETNVGSCSKPANNTQGAASDKAKTSAQATAAPKAPKAQVRVQVCPGLPGNVMHHTLNGGGGFYSTPVASVILPQPASVAQMQAAAQFAAAQVAAAQAAAQAAGARAAAAHAAAMKVAAAQAAAAHAAAFQAAGLTIGGTQTAGKATAATRAACQAAAAAQAPGQASAATQAAGKAPTATQAAGKATTATSAAGRSAALSRAAPALNSRNSVAQAAATPAPGAPVPAKAASPGPAEAPQAAITPADAPAKVDDPKSEDSGAESFERDASPDKTEDWTLINKDKDLDSDSESTPASASNDNLPEEFQTRASIGTSQLYPPLNTATAEMEEGAKAEAGQGAGDAQAKINMPRGREAAPSAPAADAADANAAPGQPRHHRTPHIDAAVRQMISMGFTNEGGWLSQLLESKDGNIAAVLDLLTPVNPNRK